MNDAMLKFEVTGVVTDIHGDPFPVGTIIEGRYFEGDRDVVEMHHNRAFAYVSSSQLKEVGKKHDTPESFDTWLKSARQCGLWFKWQWITAWFSPEEMERDIKSGKIEWRPREWVLADPRAEIERIDMENLVKRRAKVQQHIDEVEEWRKAVEDQKNAVSALVG